MESYFKQMIMILLAISIFNRVNSQQTYEKVTYYLDTTTSALNLTCQGQTRVYQSAISGTWSVMQFQINTGYGYLSLFYTLELHTPTILNNDIIFLESGQIVYTIQRFASGSILTNFCSSTSYVQFIQFTSSTMMNQQQATLYVKTNTAITFQIKNLNIYAERCQLHCKTCNEFKQCTECMPNFTIGQWGRCQCDSSFLTYYQGQCITSCPANHIFDGTTCIQYSQLINLLYDDTASKFTMYPDYNTTQRECKTTLEGKQVAGLFIQNEIVEYRISNPTATPINIQIEAEFYLFNLQLKQSLDLFLKLNDYLISKTLIMNTIASQLSALVTINQHLCYIVGFDSCLRFTIIQKFENVLDPQSIQFQLNIPLERKEITWAISSINVNAVYLSPITCPFKRFQNECVDECPITSRTSGSECISIINDYKFSKILLIQNTDNFAIKQQFNVQNPCYLLENTISLNCKFYLKRYLQGGELTWRDYQIKLKLNNLSPHYKLKLFLKAILIDPVDSQQSLIVSIDETKYVLNKNSPNSYCFSGVVTAGCIIQEDLGTSTADYLINFEQEFDHSNTDLEIGFTCNIKRFVNSYCTMYDIIVLQANCPENCQYCTSDSVCIQAEQYLQVFYDCPSEGYYYSQGACLSCLSFCKTCTDGFYCTTCKDQYVKFGNLCFCKFNLALATYTDCSEEDCHPSCSKCLRKPYAGYNHALQFASLLCASCDRNEHKVLSFDICECFQGYYMDQFSYPNKCILCRETCKTCSDATSCLTCFPEQNRILQDYQCQCIQGYFENGLDFACIKCKQTCKYCLYKEEYCTKCYPEQYRQLSIQNTCICQAGYYEDTTTEICLKCSDYCNTCSDFSICTSCNDFQFRTLDLRTKQCICQSGYYDIQQLDCSPCYYACSKCNNSDLISQCTACPNSRQKSAHNIETFECKCKKGYFDDGYLECLPCNSMINPPITHYCYSHCGDLIIQWNEECDDGNLDPRDGCNQCFLQNPNCIDNICLQCQNNKCLQCIDGYYLNNDYACIQCSDECSKCESSQNNCTQCKFNKLSTDKCLNCSQEQGFVQIDDECFSICGDGIRTFQEFCDDGNQLIGDGCDQYCNVEDGYICNLQCEKINYLEILLKEDHLDTIYDSIRTIELKLNQEVKIATNNSIIDFIKITSTTPNLILTVINVKDYSSFKNDYFNVGLDLSIELNSSAISPNITVTIQNYTLFTNQQGYTFKTNNASIQLIDFIKQDQFVLKNSQNLIQMSSYFLYILLGLAILAMIFGGLDIFWNLLDTLQLICYLKYFNVSYPYNLQYYFTIFGFAEFDFIKSYFDFEYLITQYVDTPEADPKFNSEGYSTVFLINIISVLFVFLTTSATFMIIKALLYFINKITKDFSEDMILNEREKINLFTFLFYKMANSCQKYFLKIVTEFKSAIIRTFMASAYDLNIAIFLQFKDIHFDHPILRLSSICAIFVFFLEVYFIYNGFVFMSKDQAIYKLPNTKQNYGSLFEGLNLERNRFNYYFNLFIVVKKVAFIALLVFLYNTPCLQISLVSLLSLTQGLFLFFNQSLEDHNELTKQITCEIILWIAEILILTFGFNEQSNILNRLQILNIGWIVMGFLSLIIFVQLIIDCRQHFQFLNEKYLLLKKLRLWFQQYFKQDEVQSSLYTDSSQFSIIFHKKQKQLPNIPSVQGSEKQINQRRIVSFNLR
ncbi:unnamed protein product (macronuclear) [Paramecium tetraurelia]|uniref:EGF-like domain-containing protein n=1 Tax=Paramecium tetraurelia TaxID=5888 RepID=A0E621_PARTE|nr:uncharacterized protein GSPATT00003601001 [Paramecium tetraurelia]CAK90738.1 unnamed protein product [Paramecium tetraurelia]|eukprot:XP_001458135.1 hypothetical protein (macronuclear) [Paramecium tetraurelia strain d4-2]